MVRSIRIPLLFAAFVLLPGLILSVFAWRALEQERASAKREARDHVETVAANAAKRAELDLAAWQTALEQFDDRSPQLPLLLRSGVLAARTSDGLRVWPERTIPWTLERDQPHATPVLPEDTVRAEKLEFAGNFSQAAVAYRQALSIATAAQKPYLLHRLARTLQNTPSKQEAREAWLALASSKPALTIAGLPVDLMARFQLGDASLYGDLVAGKWKLSKESYLFYASRLRPGEPVELERRKLETAAAIEAAMESVRGRIVVEGTEWLCLKEDAPFRVWLTPLKALVPKLTRNEARDFDAAFGEPPRGTTVVIDGAARLRLNVWPRNPGALEERYFVRRDVYLGVLLLAVATMFFGAWLTFRTVRREVEVARLKSEFVATVSHEFRSPLAGISQLGEMLRDGRVRDDARRQDYYEMIVSESRRLRRLVENLLDFARLEESRKLYRFESVDVRPWLDAVAREFQSEVAPRGYQLEAAVESGLPHVKADREALATAVHNLLDNAVKYSPESKTVWLETGAENGGLAIRVRDRGIGIAEGERARVFEKFYRIGGSMKEEVQGAGLGLALVTRIVADHGGRVSLESREGEGSTFTIHLPPEQA